MVIMSTGNNSFLKLRFNSCEDVLKCEVECPQSYHFNHSMKVFDYIKFARPMEHALGDMLRAQARYTVEVLGEDAGGLERFDQHRVK